MSENNTDLNEVFEEEMDDADVIIVPIDETLSNSGEAADAAAVGAALALKADKDELPATIKVNNQPADNQGLILIDGTDIPVSDSNTKTLAEAIEEASEMTAATIPMTGETGAATIGETIGVLQETVEGIAGNMSADKIPMSEAEDAETIAEAIGIIADNVEELAETVEGMEQKTADKVLMETGSIVTVKDAIETLDRTAVKSVNRKLPDASGDVDLSVVPLAENLQSDKLQSIEGEFTLRTTSGTGSVSDGKAYPQHIYGNSRHDGFVAEVLNLTVIPIARTEPDEPITATIDRDTFLEEVEDSDTINLYYTTEWSEDPADYGVTVTGDPVAGDQITIVYVKEVRGTIVVAEPERLVGTGWNLFNYNAGYARVVKYSETYGYKIGGTFTSIAFAASLTDDRISLLPNIDGLFSVPGDGYVFVTGGNNTDTYILTTWSDWIEGPSTGYWEAYRESGIDLSAVVETYFPYGMLKVGTVRDEIDLVAKRTISRIERMVYNEENRATAAATGRAYDFDENNIYVVRAEPVLNAITIDSEYSVSEHGLEWFTETELPLDTEILYGKNLRDKLERNVLTISAQTLTEEEKSQVRTNIGAMSQAEGDTKLVAPTEAGTAGQLLHLKEDGGTEWTTQGTPTDAQVGTAVSAWLDAHPEATTTVEDGAISRAKLNDDLKAKTDAVPDLKSALYNQLVEVEFSPGLSVDRKITTASGKSATDAKYTRTGVVQAAKGERAAVGFVSDTYEFAAFYYGPNGSISTGADYLNRYTPYCNGIILFPDDVATFGLSFRRKDNAELTSTDRDTIQSIVTAYMYTDTTLTKKNYPADAKVVNDKFLTERSGIDSEIESSVGVMFSASQGLSGFFFETDNSDYLYIKSSGTWYLRGAVTKNGAYADIYDGIDSEHKGNAPSGETGCIKLASNDGVVYDISAETWKVVSLTSSFNTDYVPIFVAGYYEGNSKFGVVKGLGQYLYQAYFSDQQCDFKIEKATGVSFTVSQGLEGCYFETDGDAYLYLKALNTWYLRGAVVKNASYADILTSNKETSPKGITNCVKLASNDAIVYDTSDNTWKIVSIANSYSSNHIPIFVCGYFDGYKQFGVVNGIGQYLYSAFQSGKRASETIYKSQIDEVVQKVLADRDNKTITFGLITDSHHGQKLTGTDILYDAIEQVKLFNSVCEKCADFTVHLGDAIGGMKALSVNMGYLTEYAEAQNDTFLPFMYVIGHHEMYGQNYSTSYLNDPTAIPMANVLGALGRRKYNNPVYSDSGDNWYFDLEGIRFIGIDSVHNSSNGFNNEAKSFLQTAVNTTNKIIVLSHVPANAGVNWNKRSPNSGSAIETTLNGATAEVLAYLHGHTHWDNSVVVTGNSFPYIATCCAVPDKTDSSKFCDLGSPTVYDRTIGDYSEFCFDIVNVHSDTGAVKHFRFGVGTDRVYPPVS